MLQDILKNGKTISGASIMLVVWALQQLGVQSTVEEVGGILGAILTVAGLTHKVVKKNRK